ncbi:MAG: hypothetical protein GY945_03960 [Rhodobacteraceae bacterium]|nr:hypothetical protein [Paracoccaceae bacterium]
MTIILFILIGAVVGCLSSWVIEMKTGSPVAIGICALGGLAGGVLSQLVIPLSALITGIIGACVGAALLMWVFSAAVR